MLAVRVTDLHTLEAEARLAAEKAKRLGATVRQLESDRDPLDKDRRGNGFALDRERYQNEGPAWLRDR